MLIYSGTCILKCFEYTFTTLRKDTDQIISDFKKSNIINTRLDSSWQPTEQGREGEWFQGFLEASGGQV